MRQSIDWSIGSRTEPYLDSLRVREPESISSRNPASISPARADALARAALSSVNSPEHDNPENWQQRALCAQTDPEIFFPEKGGSVKEAKKVCSECEVRAECLDYALNNDERFGVWGGLTNQERNKLKRRGAYGYLRG